MFERLNKFCDKCCEFRLSGDRPRMLLEYGNCVLLLQWLGGSGFLFCLVSFDLLRLLVKIFLQLLKS